MAAAKGDMETYNNIMEYLPEIQQYVIMEGLSMAYGWTPEQIRAIPVEDLMAYWAINAARAKKGQPSTPAEPLRRMMR